MLLESDTVRMKVAPFVLADNTMPVEDDATTVHVTDLRAANADLRAKLNAAFPGNVSAPLFLPLIDSDAWQQDGYEIGYAKAPYGSMPVVVDLGRAHLDPDFLAEYVRRTIFRKDVAVSTKLADMWKVAGSPPPFTTDDSGGNIESIPKPEQPGYFFHGSGMGAHQTDFFAPTAQDVNEDLAVNTDWLQVKHVDEVISVATDGERVVVADPEAAWALLEIAARIDIDAKMHDGMNGNPAGGIEVGEALLSIEFDPAIVGPPVVTTYDPQFRFKRHTIRHASCKSSGNSVNRRRNHGNVRP